MVPQGGRKYIDAIGQLFPAMNAMAYLFPMYQILTMKNRYPRKIFEGAGNQIIVITHPTYTWIGVKPRYYRVGISNRSIWIGEGSKWIRSNGIRRYCCCFLCKN